MKGVSPTPEQDAEFDAYVVAWAERLGLHDWHIYRRLSKAPGAAADVNPLMDARQAGYRTGNFGHTVITSPALEETALHEMLHVLLADICYAYEHSDDATICLAAEHRVINVLTKLLLKGAT